MWLKLWNCLQTECVYWGIEFPSTCCLSIVWCKQCLVQFQIGDFGMSRDLEDNNYYITHGGKIPVKWTAPEVNYFKNYLHLYIIYGHDN